MLFRSRGVQQQRAVGDNATLVTTLAKDRGTVKILGLVISNADVYKRQDMNTLIETMTPADLRSAAAAAERGGAVPLSDVELLAPIPRPRQGSFFLITCAPFFGFRLCVLRDFPTA